MLCPGIELPAHALDHRCRTESAAAIPHTLALLAVFGFSRDHQASAHPAIGRKKTRELFRQLTGHEHQGVRVMHRLFEHPLHLHARRRIVGAGQAVVAATGNAMSEHTERAETGQHIGLR